MLLPLPCLRPLMRRFARDQDGSYSVEAVIWLPAFTLVIALIIDLSAIYSGKAEIARVIQDANRAYSTGSFTNQTQIETYVSAALDARGQQGRVHTVIQGDLVETRVSLSAAAMSPIGIFPVLRDLPVNMSFSHHRAW
jgi:Flp pilus assembly protein TadG